MYVLDICIMAKDKLDAELQLKKIGDHLRRLRIASGIKNYEHFAYEHKINRGSYGKYELGHNMKVSTLIKLAAAHGLTLEEFFNCGYK